MSEKQIYDLEVELEKRGEKDEDLLDSIPTERVDEGKELYAQGQSPVEFSVIRLGKLQVAKQSSDGSKSILGIFGPGQPVGAMAVLKNFPYPATVVAIKPTIVYRFSADLIPKLKEKTPDWFSDCLGNVAERFTDLADRFQSVSTKNLEERLARHLWHLAEKYGKEDKGVIQIDTKLTRQMLADMVGCSVESAIRRLSKWEQKGLIRTLESRIHLLKPDQIKSMADE